MYRAGIDPDTKKRIIVSTRKVIVRNDFGLWLNQNMLRIGMTQTDVAKKLHVSRQSVTGHSTGMVKPTFQNVVSYCWVFGNKDDPEEVWKLVE